MNYLNKEQLAIANEQAIYNLYTYLVKYRTPIKGQKFGNIIEGISNADIPNGDRYKLRILKNAVNNTEISTSRLVSYTISRDGLTACVFVSHDGKISVIFKGTGEGEWIDNGEGLSGICEENTYISYDQISPITNIYDCDYASDQQAEALNWFLKTVSESGLNKYNEIIVSGHSKGGNKAQFVAINSDLVSSCYSFDGQGFSPEALEMFKNRHGTAYEKRRKSILSLSADNDYVNVLGSRLMPEENIFFFRSFGGLHPLEAILDQNGEFYHQTKQGLLSKYMEGVSKQIMKLPPRKREYATLGIMNICQRYLGKGTPVNDDKVSFAKTLIGITIAVSKLLLQFGKKSTD